MSKANLWITRTQPGADKSADHWRKTGFKAIVRPLLTVGTPAMIPPLPPFHVSLIITSQNALLMLAEMTARRHWPIIAVGDATANLARSLGFNQVISVSGASEELTQFILSQSHQPGDGYVHVAGTHVRGTIAEDLNAAGIACERHIFYETSPVKTLPTDSLEAINVVALYSPKGAKALASLSPDTAHMTALSMSAAIDAELEGMTFRRRLIAPEPSEAAMIRTLEKAL